MSKLTKLLLINWMYFQKELLIINDNTAIVGVNGSGKSTIIDAIQMLLLGQQKAKFNSGAEAEKRTLESYVRGHVASDNKEYLRPNDVITYLALEVEISGKTYIFGMNVEYNVSSSSLNGPRYFYVEDAELSDSLFVTASNFPKPYDDFSKEMKHQFNFTKFDTLGRYQAKIKDLFGLKQDNSYFKILSRAIGIKNIKECNKFMNDFVLDEKNIDVSSIKKNIEEMQKLEMTITEAEDKCNRLDEIVKSGTAIAKQEDELQKTTIERICYSILNLESEIDRIKSELKQIDSSLEEVSQKKASLGEEEEKANKEILALGNMLENQFPDLAKKQEEKKRIEEKYQEQKREKDNFSNRCDAFIKEQNKTSHINNPKLNAFFKFLKAKNYTTRIAQEEFNSIKGEMTELDRKYYFAIKDIENNITNVNRECEEIKEVIRKLDNNQLSFSKRYDNFKANLSAYLYNKYHQVIEVKLLCEYLEITDEKWRNAIEGYLGSQRFYIVVPNEYYNDALRFYEQNKELSDVHIINGIKLPQADVQDGTLASFIESYNRTALNYARYLLKRVHCAASVYDLENYPIAITSDCICYQNYSVWRINPNNYRDPFIGANGIKKQLTNKKNELTLKLEELEELNKKAKKHKEIESQIKHVLGFVDDIINMQCFKSLDEVSILIKKIDEQKKVIEFYESNPKYMEIHFKMEKLKKENAARKAEEKQLEEKGQQLSSQNGSLNNMINNNQSKITDLGLELNRYDQLLVNTINNSLDKTMISSLMIDKLERQIKVLETLISKSKQYLSVLMSEARNLYNINAGTSYEDLAKYKVERDQINENAFKYKNLLLELQDNNKKMFFSEFLSKLSGAIEMAKMAINNLNSGLSEFNFGDLSYKIVIKTTENEELARIYNYAKKYNSENTTRDIFNYDGADNEADVIKQIFEEYMFSKDVSVQQLILDYRNYLSFDVDIKSLKGEGTKSLNKVIKSQSGGEVQVPFYILSGVAFKQTLDYKRNKDVLGIVLYDEAFDKMDSQRIQAMLNFYREKLNLQVVIAAPGKLDSFVDNVDTILVVVRDGDKASVSEYNYES